MIIEYKCKKCGGRVMGETLCVYPPIHQMKCQKCHRVVSSYQEEITTEVI